MPTLFFETAGAVVKISGSLYHCDIKETDENMQAVLETNMAGACNATEISEVNNCADLDKTKLCETGAWDVSACNEQAIELLRCTIDWFTNLQKELNNLCPPKHECKQDKASSIGGYILLSTVGLCLLIACCICITCIVQPCLSRRKKSQAGQPDAEAANDDNKRLLNR